MFRRFLKGYSIFTAGGGVYSYSLDSTFEKIYEACKKESTRAYLGHIYDDDSVPFIFSAIALLVWPLTHLFSYPLSSQKIENYVQMSDTFADRYYEKKEK